MSGWLAGAAVVAAGTAAYGANQAGKKQAGAAGAANDLQASIYYDTRDRNDPFYYAGTDALNLLQQRLPDLTSGYDPSKLTSEAGYQFGLQEGQKALERSLAARGLGVSGAALKAASRYGTDYGTTKLNDAFTRDMQTKRSAYDMLSGLVNVGQSSANQTAAAGSRFADQAGANLIGAGNAAAANSIAQGNIWGNLLNQGASAYGRRNNAAYAPSWSTAGGGSGMWLDGAGSPGSDGTMYLAEGGAVPMLFQDDGSEVLPARRRQEPVVGTKAPKRRGGGGGGMSREAVLAALDAAAGSSAGAAPAGMASLPANPVTNPQGITEGRMRTAGLGYADGGKVHRGAVRSKAPGKADTVPAHLSGGEHVVDAETVSMLGDGNNEAGHDVLEDLKQRVRAFKRATPVDRPARAIRG